MPLPEDYLRYAKRGHGQDHDRYAWRLAGDRAPVRTEGVRLAVSLVVPLEWFMLDPSGKPFKHPGAMQTPYPDLRHFTTRDYGNRVGAFRLLKVFADAGVKATFAVNGALLARIPPLVEAISSGGHEIAAHGWDTDSIHWSGLDPEAEESLVRRTREAFAAAGHSPRIWMGPARQQSARTLDIIAAAGFDICLDWEVDVVPTPARTDHGVVTLFPLLNELDDRTLLTVKNHSEDDWRDQILEAAAMTAAEHDRRGAQCFALTLTPYVAGQPFRIAALRQMLAGHLENARVAPVGEVVSLFGAASR